MKNPGSIEDLESRLDSFDPSERKDTLNLLCQMVRTGDIRLPEPGTDVNVHCHTFFSYNSYGYSPSRFAWLARRKGLAVAGVVEFDVLDSLDEFYEAGRMLGLKTCVSVETRVHVPEFTDRVINSPGEPGISYHMGVGLPTADLEGDTLKFQKRLHTTAQGRNRDLVKRVNNYLRPVELDYDRDVIPLTPSGNPLERHICAAYARKAQEIFEDDQKLAGFWADKLGVDGHELDLPDGPGLQELIRAKTMKRGGVGYVQPETGSFPEIADMNRFVLAAGGIPAHAWLDGTSEGEQAMEELLEVSMSSGSAALNIIPDRDYTANAGSEEKKVREMYRVVELAEKLDLILVAGTEMNKPGQSFVDDFASMELSPLAPVLLKGAHIVYGHCVLQRGSGLGYTSKWAEKNFPKAAARNGFFEALGSGIRPDQEKSVAGLEEDRSPEEILGRIG